MWKERGKGRTRRPNGARSHGSDRLAYKWGANLSAASVECSIATAFPIHSYTMLHGMRLSELSTLLHLTCFLEGITSSADLPFPTKL